MPTNAKEGGQAIIQRIIDIIESYDNIDRVAISTAGQVDSKNGIVVYSTDNIPYYTGMMVKSIIENKTGIEAFKEAMLQNEFKAEFIKNMFMIFVFTAIGIVCAIIDEVRKNKRQSGI